MGVLSNKISREELKPGDHIYSWRANYVYSHHGIYVGDGMVIHFTKEQHHGITKTSIDDFLREGNLYIFKYGVSLGFFIAKTRGGTCTTAHSDPMDEVIYRATYHLNKGFGKYNLFLKNCEIFAVYCKTGLLIKSIQQLPKCGHLLACRHFATCGQWASWDTVGTIIMFMPVFIFITTMFPLPLACLMASLEGSAIWASYSHSRYTADIGVRRDVIRIPLEELVMEAGDEEHQGAGEVNAH